MRAGPIIAIVAATVLSACIAVPATLTPSPAPSPEDGVVINTNRTSDDALFRVYRAMVAGGLPVDAAASGARRLQTRPWTIAGDTSLSVDASVLETQSAQVPTVVVLSATWSSSSGRVRRRLVTSQDAPGPWAALQRLGESVRELMKP